MTIEHSTIPNAQLHESKGIATASAGAIIVADGGGGSAMSNTASTPVNLYDNELRRPIFKDYAEIVSALGNTTATTDVNIENGNTATATLAVATTTFTFSNPPATGKLGTLTLILTQDGTGSRLVTWPASVKWAGGTVPTLTTTAAGIDIFSFMTINAGTTWYGFTGGKAFA